MRALPQPKPEDFDLATVLHALGDPVRLELLRRLTAEGETTCSPEGVTVPRSTLSNHWRILREAGITSTHISGKTRLVTLRRNELDARFPRLLGAVLDEFTHPSSPPPGASSDPISGGSRTVLRSR
ncbi:DNA-binding transcriptional ArsR family regulator [Kitasatospora sp. MAA4]|uniref:ArsR/SmtB family transcription factor n=1 Tax=Kitasatospora sp. MAA4 TaxID=3035093 RepID=UPI0024736616|nr:helix-turn-helix domain-containing protein [Kitasatospora sp. MAA4]MDH6137096.1 DNA-binding transcriptional ArsR family regulator [Kitasatospora sp. MAA4]